jgi:hypothetical protein
MQWRTYKGLSDLDVRLVGRSTAELALVMQAMRRRL